MFKTIMNLSRVMKDITVIASKETAYQISKANDTSASATGKLADKTASCREKYEQKLRERKAKANDPSEKVIHVLPSPQQEQDN